MRVLLTLACLLIAMLAAPAQAQNQFPDPNLADGSGLSLMGAPEVAYDLPTLRFENGGSGDYYLAAGAVNTALLDAWPIGEDRQFSAYAVAYSSGDLQCRMRGGAWVNLGLAGTGMSAAVTITAGATGAGLQCRGVYPATFSLRARPSNGDPIFAIAP